MPRPPSQFLRTHLAKGGLLVSFLDVAEMHLRDVDDRDLLRSFTDYAALTLDRGRLQHTRTLFDKRLRATTSNHYWAGM